MLLVELVPWEELKNIQLGQLQGWDWDVTFTFPCRGSSLSTKGWQYSLFLNFF